MKRIFALVAAFTLAASAAQAQTAISQSGANSTSLSGSQSASGAQSNNSIVFGSPPANTTAEIKNVPSVSAPSVFGGGHPCLAGRSGGLSVLGGGASYGQGEAEAICMLMVLGQQEAALRALAATSPKACKALENVGYYIVAMGNGRTKAVAFRCDNRTVKGGVFSGQAVAVGQGTPVAAAPAATTVRPKARPALYSKCEFTGGKVRIAYTSAGKANKSVAQKACLTELGY